MYLPGLIRESKMNKSVGDLIKSVKNERVMLLKGSGISVKRLSTQIVALDRILGGNGKSWGLPLGCIMEVYGDEGTGKTTLALQLLAAVQKAKGIAVYVDVEQAPLDPDYLSRIGVDVGNLILSQPDSGEDALQTVKDLMIGKLSLVGDKPLMIVVDSAAALASQAELDSDIKDDRMSPTATLLSKSLRRLKSIVSETDTILLFTNQIRDVINIGGYKIKFKQVQTPGGKALKFYSTVRLELKRKNMVKVQDKFIGQNIWVKIIKNKTFPPFNEVELRLIWGQGIDSVYSLFNQGIAEGIIERSGSWYNFGDFKHHGEGAFLEGLRNDADMIRAITEKLRNA